MKIVKILFCILAIVWLVLVFLWAGITLCSFESEKNKPLFVVDKTVPLQVHTKMLDAIWCKDFFINLNGGWSRLLGQKRCNGILKLNNGHSSKINKFFAPNITAASMDNLSSYCNQLGIQSLYVMFPYKIDTFKSVVPRGAPKDYTIESADAFLSELKNTNAIDLRPLVSNSPEAVTQNFFKTDHHWNFYGAMAAFPSLVSNVVSLLDVNPSDIIQTNSNAWSTRSLGRPFLGSFGRRTGAWYNGYDYNVSYFVPNFPTEIFLGIPKHKIWRRGTFEETNIFYENIKKPQSYLLDPGYSVYGYDYPLIIYRNNIAPIKNRVLIIKDSYAIPINNYFSTVFSEVVAIDLRKYNELSPLEYIKLYNPDIVCVMYHPGGLDTNMFEFGNFDEVSTKNVSILKEIDQIILDDFNINNDSSLVAEGLYPQMKVALSIGEITSNYDNYNDLVSIILASKDTDKILFEDKICVNYREKQKIIFSVPDEVGECKLILKIPNKNKKINKSISFGNVKVEYLK